MEDRRTLRSGLPKTLTTELEGLTGALIAASPTGVLVDAARYRLERVVGRGVLFVTFQATRIDRAGAVPFAVKVLRPSLVRAWPEGVKVLSRDQARVLAILNDRLPPSAHVVRLLDGGELARDETRGVERTVPWLALEWVDGGPAGTSLFSRARTAVSDTQAAVDPRTALAILRGIARGLDFVHRHGLLHRGLSPNNVLLVGHGARTIAKVEGVSIARPAGLPPGFGFERGEGETLPVTASLPYLAPEQFAERSRALGPAVDVFAFGAVARFVLTGLGPTTHDPPLIEATHLHPTFRRLPSAMRAIDRALVMAASFEPDERPATIESMWALLEPHLREVAIRAEADDVPISPPRPRSEEDEVEPARGVWVWTERHRPEGGLKVRAASFDEQGHALSIARAAGSRTDDVRLLYFDGRAHVPMIAPTIAPEQLAQVGYLGLGRWALLAMAGRAVLLEEGGHRELLREGRLVLQAACGEVDRRLAIVGASASSAPMLHVLDRGVPRGALSLDGAAVVTSLVELDDRGLVLVGRALTGGPYIATYDHEQHHVRPQSPPGQAPLTAVASHGDGVAYAVGAGGLAVRITRFSRAAARLQCTPEPTTTAEDLVAVSLDERGTPWAAGRGIVLRRTPTASAVAWAPSFRDADSAPIVALAARRAFVLAMTVDGVVLEGRSLG